MVSRRAPVLQISKSQNTPPAAPDLRGAAAAAPAATPQRPTCQRSQLSHPDFSFLHFKIWIFMKPASFVTLCILSYAFKDISLRPLPNYQRGPRHKVGRKIPAPEQVPPAPGRRSDLPSAHSPLFGKRGRGTRALPSPRPGPVHRVVTPRAPVPKCEGHTHRGTGRPRRGSRPGVRERRGSRRCVRRGKIWGHGHRNAPL